MIQVLLDLEISFPDAVSFVPMQLNSAELAVRKFHGRLALSLSPSARTVDLPKQRTNLYAATRRNRFRLADLSDDLELSSTIVNDEFQVRKAG